MITLTGLPRADSEYVVTAGTRLGRPVSFVLQVDGVGHPHPLFDFQGTHAGVPRGALPRYGLVGHQLAFAVVAPKWIATACHLYAFAGARSLQDMEPMISNPSRDGDRLPTEACLQYPSGGTTTEPGYGICYPPLGD